MRVPDFLVIGAMKAGTTSLCRDLDANPQIFFPSVKEPHTLCLNRVLEPEGRADYSALFKDAGPDQLCGEGSTGYSKLPTHQNVPDRAFEVIGPDLKLIYIVREPISRALSHHYHLFRAGDAPQSMRGALSSHPEIVEVGRYAMQLEPWIRRFGRENLHVIRFESYVSHRKQVVNQAFRFLGVAVPPENVQSSEVHNSGDEQLMPPKYLKRMARQVTRSQWYKRIVHPRTPVWLREKLKSGLYQEAPPRPELPPQSVIESLLEHYCDEVEKLRLLLGHDEPLWSLDDVADSFRSRASVTE